MSARVGAVAPVSARVNALGAARTLTALLVLLGALVVLVLASAPAHAADEPDAPAPHPLSAGPGVPPDIADWFALEGPDAVVAQGAGQLPGMTAQQRGDVEIGAVRTVMEWAPGLIEGTDLTPAAQPRTNPAEYAAPLVLDDTAVGVLFADEGEDADPTPLVSGATELAEAMRGLDLADPLIHDVPLDGWFTVTGGEVRPLDPAARGNLAGAAPLEVYQPFIQARARQVEGSATPGAGAPVPASQGGGPEPFVWVAVALAVVLVWAGIVVWLRRPEDGGRTEQTLGRHARGQRPERGVRR
ncbi:hypothetical protein [Georgenia yuyongxinii]